MEVSTYIPYSCPINNFIEFIRQLYCSILPTINNVISLELNLFTGTQDTTEHEFSKGLRILYRSYCGRIETNKCEVCYLLCPCYIIGMWIEIYLNKSHCN